MIYFLGDNHGRFDYILPAIQADIGDGRSKAVVFLGDLECQRPLEDEIAPLLNAGVEVHFIHGNHDTDHVANWDNLVGGWDRNLDNRVVVIQGLRVAGLGGVSEAKSGTARQGATPARRIILPIAGRVTCGAAGGAAQAPVLHLA